MLKYIFIFICAGLTGCNGQNNNTAGIKTDTAVVIKDSTYYWTKILDSVGWKKSYNFQMFTVNDTAWTFHPDGNWFSADGINWIKSTLPNAINNLAFLDYIYFNNAMYGLGHFEGNIEQFSFSPTIYKTSDFKQWTTLTTTSNLPARFFYYPVVFQNKIWIIGGEDKNTQYADVWNSADAVKWVKQKDSLPFGKRGKSNLVVFNNQLFLMDNDIWTSADGLTWELLTKEIVKGEQLFGYTPIVFDNKIWLLGCNRNGNFTSQVLVSEDGKNWQGQTAPWSPRGGIAATVFKDGLYITGGKYGGLPNQPDFRYSNDLWVLHKK